MAHEAIGHRGKAFADLYARIPPRLQKVFRTEGFVFTTTSAATGLWEAALLNLAPERVLALVSGAFSERWAACARDLGIAVDVLEAPWGSPVDPEEVRRALGKARYEAVTVVHSETSTGTLNDLAAIARAVREALRRVRPRRRRDLARRLARRVRRVGPRLRPLGIPEGARAAAGPRCRVRLASASESARRTRSRAHYLRLSEAEAFAEKNQTPYTPSTPHLFALDVQLDHILRGDHRGPLGAARRAAPPRRVLGGRAGPRATLRPRARGRGPSRA